MGGNGAGETGFCFSLLFLIRRPWFLTPHWNDLGNTSDNRGIKPITFIESLSLLELIETR